MAFRIGIDVGGTFTDLVLMWPGGATASHKELSTPQDPSLAVVGGLGALAAKAGLPLERFMAGVELIVHGTTVTTNAVLTGRTARTGLLATRGLTDALQMRRGIREQMFDNRWHPPAPVVPRERRLPVGGRLDAEGREIEPLDEADVRAAVERLRADGVEAVAICFMHAHASAAHEQRAAAIVREALPQAYCSVSSEVLPQVRYYERTSTTALNAAVGPVLARYLGALQRRLDELRWRGTLLVMQSNGGVASLAAVTQRAAATLLSGPAAAPAAALACLGRAQGSFVSVDMGGTSFDAVLVKDGAPEVTTQGRVNGYALALPGMEIHTIGAGGGSIAWVDEGGLLHMGPQSAGAHPGPACYGRGGTQATCTDADLLLGYLGAESFAGGRMPLDRAAAERAVRERVAAKLGTDAVGAAWGMFEVINVAMAAAIREVSVRRGHDPRTLPLVCAGGAGPVHGAAIAAELGITRVVVPRDASTFCASGMLRTDLVHDRVRSIACTLPEGVRAGAPIRALWREMARDARALLRAEGFAGPQQQLRCRMDLRYAGQYHEVDVELPAECVESGDWDGVRERFHQRHERLYGYQLREEATPVELLNLRLAAVGVTDKPRRARQARASDDWRAARIGRRPVYLGPQRGFRQVPVLDGERLRHGHCLDGPAVVETPNTTIVVPAACRLSVDAFGHCVLDLPGTEGGGMTRRTRDAVDAVELAVLQRRLKSVTEEMGLALLRTTRSPILSEARDFVTGLYDARGRMLEQTEYIPVLAFALQPACEHVIRYFGDDVHEGDVILHNDVFSGGNQNNDVAVFKPVFHRGALVAWAACKGHQADIGGAVRGGYNPNAREVWQEALRIPPLKIVERGRLRRDVWDMVFANIRLPIVAEDIKAQIGGCRVGERGMLELVQRFGAARLPGLLEALFERTGRMLRAEVAAIPDGRYTAESWVFDDGHDESARMRIALAIEVRGERLRIDLTGSSPQTPGFVNAPASTTRSALLLSLLMLVSPDIPHNDGLVRAIEIVNPEGSFLNAAFPAATTFGNSLTGPISDAVFRAMADALPERVCAGWNRFLGMAISGHDPRHDRPYADILFLSLKGGSGAVRGADGYDHIGLINCAGGILAQDYEMFEIHDPHLLRRHEYSVDSAGAGRWRGGLGVETEFEIRGERVGAVVFGDGVEEAARAFGLFGGQRGARNELTLTAPDGSVRRPRAKQIVEGIAPGTVLRQRAGGGGGYGDPAARDPDAVLADVRCGVVSVAAARRDYKVWIDVKRMTVDAKRTAALRAKAGAIA